jgi:undecaprenyl-diphosphatase
VRIKAFLVAVVAFACFVGLGEHVVRHGESAMLLSVERSLLDRSTLVAWWLTWSCYVDVLAPIATALLVTAWLAPAWRARIFFSIVLLLLCWRGADFFQHVFARPRPAHWVVKHEAAFSYPSSHAAIATGFCAVWAVMLYFSELPLRVRALSGFLLIALTVGICWSRLALGAHYVTDLIGGALLAVALVCAALTAVPIRFAGRVAGRATQATE